MSKRLTSFGAKSRNGFWESDQLAMRMSYILTFCCDNPAHTIATRCRRVLARAALAGSPTLVSIADSQNGTDPNTEVTRYASHTLTLAQHGADGTDLLGISIL
jgi:hypothetical protein